MLIDGELVAGDDEIEVINPATGAVFASSPKASKAQVDQAVAAATAAILNWSRVEHSERQGKLIELADAILARRDDLARVLVMEQGKPLPEAEGEIAWAGDYLRHYATLALPDRVIQDDENGLVVLEHRPIGVVAGIIAWNFPLLLACWKIGPAVLAGNAIVLKPAPTTPLTALMLGKICRDIFPNGVVNVVTGDNELGPYLTAHPDVAKVAFTGSTKTGQSILRSAADSIKRVTLELGGNDPAIVLDDVDVVTTAQAIFDSAFLNCGQVCLAVKRAYVHEDIYDAICAELARIAEHAVVDDGLQQGTQLGPLQNRAQLEKVQGFLDSARRDGTIVAGGEAVEQAGYFVLPTIVRDVEDGDQVVDEEQFGPILPVVSFAEVNDVVASINAGDYGLGASVWSGDIQGATAIAERIDAGQVWVNQHLAIGPHIPMAGFRRSGLGVEQSVEGLLEYTQARVINIQR